MTQVCLHTLNLRAFTIWISDFITHAVDTMRIAHLLPLIVGWKCKVDVCQCWFLKVPKLIVGLLLVPVVLHQGLISGNRFQIQY